MKTPVFLIKDVKQNWFMGIRTPWTLSNEEVWKKTHLMAQKVFIIGGIAFLFIPYVTPTYVPIIFIFVIIMIVGLNFGYSYWLWRKIEKSKKEDKVNVEDRQGESRSERGSPGGKGGLGHKI